MHRPDNGAARRGERPHSPDAGPSRPSDFGVARPRRIPDRQLCAAASPRPPRSGPRASARSTYSDPSRHEVWPGRLYRATRVSRRSSATRLVGRRRGWCEAWKLRLHQHDAITLRSRGAALTGHGVNCSQVAVHDTPAMPARIAQQTGPVERLDGMQLRPDAPWTATSPGRVQGARREGVTKDLHHRPPLVVRIDRALDGRTFTRALRPARRQPSSDGPSALATRSARVRR